MSGLSSRRLFVFFAGLLCLLGSVALFGSGDPPAGSARPIEGQFIVNAPVVFGRPAATATPIPSPTAIPTPNPLAPECPNLEQAPGKSLLKNTDFDGGFGPSAPFFWTAAIRGGSGFAELYKDSPEEPIVGFYEGFGTASVLFIGAGTFQAGIYQRVTNVAPSRWYHAFYATAQKVWGGPDRRVDGSLPILREVGVDPTGGTDPDSPNVIWGRAAGGERDRAAREYGGWKTLGNQRGPLVSFFSTGTTVTVFLRASGWDDVAAAWTWFDSAYLVPACQNGYKEIIIPGR